MNIKYTISVIIIAVLSTGMMGCDLLKKPVQKSETTKYTINAAGKNRIKINNITGDIRVARSTDTLKIVKITAMKRGRVKPKDLDKPFEDINIKIDSSSDLITVTTEIQKEKGLFKKNNSGEVDYEVIVPQNMPVSVYNTNGNLVLDYLSNDVDAEIVNGRVSFDGCSGNINLSITNGEVTGNIDSTKGLKVDMINGAVKIGKLKNISADVYASTVNGKVKFDELNLNNVSSDKKNVRGTLGDGKNSIRLSNVNGNITLSQSEVFSKLNRKLRSDDFEGLHFNFDDDENDNEHVKIDIDHNNVNIEHINDNDKSIKDTSKNKTGKTESTPKAK